MKKKLFITVNRSAELSVLEDTAYESECFAQIYRGKGGQCEASLRSHMTRARKICFSESFEDVKGRVLEL